MAGAILGRVSESGGSAVSGATVRLYRRSTGALLASTTTNAIGYYTFTGLDHTDTANFFVVAFDVSGGTQYNAEVLDLLTPTESVSRSPAPSGFDSSLWGTAAISLPDVDPHWSNVVLLLRGLGTNGSTTVTDDSPLAHTVTVHGNTQISTAQSIYGGASIYFDGNGDFLEIANHAGFDFGSGEGTVEMWVRIADSNARSFIGKTVGTGFQPFCLRSNINRFGFATVSNGSTTTNVGPNNQYAVTAWVHLAWSRVANTVYFFIDGVLQASASFSGSVVSNSAPLCVGGYSKDYMQSGGPTTGMSGYMAQVRITKGVGRYSGTFTPLTHFPIAGP